MRQRGLKNGHGRAGGLTRRQLLGQGLLAGSSLAFFSSLQLLWSKPAFAGPSQRIPFLAIDLAGGANIAGSNIMVGKKGGQLDFLSTYEGLGLPADMHPSRAGQLKTSLGLAFHAGLVRRFCHESLRTSGSAR